MKSLHLTIAYNLGLGGPVLPRSTFQKIEEELRAKTGHAYLDSGDGDERYEIWIPTNDPQATRRIIDDVMSETEPDAAYMCRLQSAA